MNRRPASCAPGSGSCAGPRHERGFTLVELMVVVLVISVLLAVAVPTFLGARERADDRSVQANLRTGLVAVRAYYNQPLAYTDVVTLLEEFEPDLEWTTGDLDASASRSTVRVAVFADPTAGQTALLGARSPTGSCFFVRDVMQGDDAGTYYAETSVSGGVCTVPDVDDVTGSSWP